MEGRTENYPCRDNFTLRVQSSLLGDNFNPGGQSLPLVAKLRMVLWHCYKTSQDKTEWRIPSLNVDDANEMEAGNGFSKVN
jgi:hypothetical protein